jgi:hypothetical protein
MMYSLVSIEYSYLLLTFELTFLTQYVDNDKILTLDKSHLNHNFIYVESTSQHILLRLAEAYSA